MIDSRDATANPGPGDTISDGVHRKKDAGDYWARAVMGQITGLKHGLLLPSSPPSDDAGAAAH